MLVCVGEAILDLFAIPRGSTLETASSFAPHLGGAPCNVAVVSARLGLAARMVGSIGVDGHGRRLRAALRSEGVDDRYLLDVPGRTAATFIEVAEDGSRSFLSYRLGAGPALELSRLDAVGDGLEGASWLYLTSSALAFAVLEETSLTFVSRAKQRSIRLCVDLNVRPGLFAARPDRSVEALQRDLRALCESAVFVKASEEDLTALRLAPTMEALRSLAPASSVCALTKAERGAELSVGGTIVRAQSPSVSVIDATGAGDAFVAAMLASWSDGAWEERLQFACSLGSRAVTQVGATAGLTPLSAERAEAVRIALLR